MKTLTLLLSTAAVAGAGLVASPAAAQPGPPPRSFTVPVVAADRRVPETAPLPLAAWRGYAWWQVFSYCEAMYSAQSIYLKRVGQAAEQARVDAEMRTIMTAAETRLMVDRGITKEIAWPLLSRETEEWLIEEGPDWNPADFPQLGFTCRLALVRHGRS
ncbi:MAG: hypothetical protein Q8J89_03015 [Caulobacter sp.]|nr:hypothetical protein [Caulobacter sp.]